MSHSAHSYHFRVKLCFGAGKRIDNLTTAYAENNVRVAVKNLFGEVGCAVPLIVSGLEDGDSRGEATFFLSCPDHAAQKIRAALTLQSSFQGHPCAYHVTHASHSILSIAADNFSC